MMMKGFNRVTSAAATNLVGSILGTQRGYSGNGISGGSYDGSTADYLSIIGGPANNDEAREARLAADRAVRDAFLTQKYTAEEAARNAKAIAQKAQEEAELKAREEAARKALEEKNTADAAARKAQEATRSTYSDPKYSRTTTRTATPAAQNNNDSFLLLGLGISFSAFLLTTYALEENAKAEAAREKKWADDAVLEKYTESSLGVRQY